MPPCHVVDLRTRSGSLTKIRLDTEILEWFREQAHAAGGGNYQTLINQALREHITAGSRWSNCCGG
jgi:uncharacterized protein (DUF4415 family)